MLIDPTGLLINLGKITLIFLLILGSLTWLLTKKRERKLRKVLLAFFGLVFIGVFTGIVLIANWDSIDKTKRQIIPDVPKTVKQIADNYIVARVGEEYFKNNFVFNKGESAKDAQNPSYHVRYDFLPLKQYTENYALEVNVYNGVAKEAEWYGGKIPDCAKDPSLCQFNLTRAELLDINEQGNPIKLEPPFLKTYVCADNLVLGTVVLRIDYRTKKVSYGPTDGPLGPCTPIQIEEEGVIRIKSTPEYKSLVDKYGSEKVSVKAVNLHDPNETKFLKKIDSGFKEQPGCIIVLEGNNEGYVYQLDEEFNVVHRVTLQSFKKGSQNVNRETMENFYSSLK